MAAATAGSFRNDTAAVYLILRLYQAGGLLRFVAESDREILIACSVNAGE
jgi:hypothetical protein